jgi:hypothetical protein
MGRMFLKFTFLITLTLAVFADVASARSLRFVYLQGFLSCTLSNRAPAHKFLEIAKEHPDARVYWGCFDGGFTQHIGDWNERFFLYTIEPNGQWSQPIEMNPRSAPLEIALMLGKELKELEESSLTSDDKLMDVMIAGHSHGGWMAMRVAYQVGLYQRARLTNLLTIDPVSYDLCHSAWFPVNAVQNTFRWWGDPHDCHRAPRDLAHIEPYIAKATNYQWINIYETSMPYLSSGPIKAATRNIHYKAFTYFDWWTAHRAILLDPANWQDFYQRMRMVVEDAPESAPLAQSP